MDMSIFDKGGKLCLLTAAVKGESLSNGAVSISRFCVGYAATSKEHAVNVIDLIIPVIKAAVTKREEYLAAVDKAETKEGAKSMRDNAKALAKQIRASVRFLRSFNAKAAMGAAFAALELQAEFPALKVNGKIEDYRALWLQSKEDAKTAEQKEAEAEKEARALVENGIVGTMEEARAALQAA